MPGDSLSGSGACPASHACSGRLSNPLPAPRLPSHAPPVPGHACPAVNGLHGTGLIWRDASFQHVAGRAGTGPGSVDTTSGVKGRGEPAAAAMRVCLHSVFILEKTCHISYTLSPKPHYSEMSLAYEHHYAQAYAESDRNCRKREKM